MYAENNVSPKEEAKGLTPDSVAYKDATVVQNDIAWKDGFIPILFEKKSVHYTKDNLRIDSIKATGLYYNKTIGKNKPIEVQFASEVSQDKDSMIVGIFLFLTFLCWGLVVKSNSDRSFVLTMILLVLSVLELAWLYLGAEKENMTIITFSWIMLFVMIMSNLIELSFDDITKITRRISGAVVILLLFIFFYFLISSSIVFFYFGSAGIILASLIVWLVNRLIPTKINK
jgi:hypothetical protein